MKQTNIVRALVFAGIAAFFGYRYYTLTSSLHLGALILFLALALFSLSPYLTPRWQTITLNIGITWLCLDLVFATIDMAEFAKALAQANYWMLVPAFIIVLVHFVVRTIRWQWLLKPMGDVAFWPAFRAMSIGLAGNIILPARAGEFLRAYVLGRSTGLRKTGVFATLVVERIFDGLTVLVFLVVSIFFGTSNEVIRQVAVAGFVVYMILLAGVVAFVLKRHWADFVINKFLPEKWAKRLLSLLDGFSSGLDIIKNPRLLAYVSLLSLATWFLIPFSFWVSLLAFDFGVPIPWPTSFVMVPMVALGMTVIATPGGVGPFQLAATITLDATLPLSQRVPNYEEVAGAASIVVHVAQLLPQLAAGFVSFWVEGLSTSDINKAR
ncbi:lysylphosphatidylglycerol synthase transmembrane domain-containing protein [Anaerolineales bacterium HSG6]|nr:lysylphosphatidylglycerol synthase transmembrane domain-containing protein [Anaerolineales bacterium HSG6]MDM8532059.1 lysylphosphatidylglycerol synthase transmembrane domain-containing protein [Anaerolineales bacterium HSG25]